MGIIGYFLLALALAADCFSVSVSCGMIQRRMGRQVLVMAASFGFFQALMPLIGWWAADLFAHKIEAYDHWIAFGLLGFIGGRMVWSGMHPRQASTGFNPSSVRVILTLAFATSIDALAIGFSFISMGIKSITDALVPLSIIGLTSVALSVIGKYIGLSIGRYFHFPSDLLGGIILIAIGLKILIQHLCA